MLRDHRMDDSNFEEVKDGMLSFLKPEARRARMRAVGSREISRAAVQERLRKDHNLMI